MPVERSRLHRSAARATTGRRPSRYWPASKARVASSRGAKRPLTRGGRLPVGDKSVRAGACRHRVGCTCLPTEGPSDLSAWLSPRRQPALGWVLAKRRPWDLSAWSNVLAAWRGKDFVQNGLCWPGKAEFLQEFLEATSPCRQPASDLLDHLGQ